MNPHTLSANWAFLFYDVRIRGLKADITTLNNKGSRI